MPRRAGVTVRPACPDDAGAVGAILAAGYPALLPAGYAPDVLAAALPRMVRPNPALLACGTYYIALVDGAPAGCGGWTAEKPGAPGEPPVAGVGHVRHFATDPRVLRRGVGRALFDRCVADAVARGVRRFHCFSSLVAVDFYAALGFRIIDRTDVPMGPDIRFPVVHMVCDLPDGTVSTG